MTSKEFIRKSLAVPFADKGRDFKAWDCWGLVFCYYKTVMGIILPEYLDYDNTSSYDQLHALITNGKTLWTPVQKPELGDVALFNLSGEPTHTALMINHRNMLHAERKIGTVIEQVNGLMWGTRLEGIYRYGKD